MKIFNYVTFLLAALALSACREVGKEKEVVEVVESSSFIVEDVEPPPPDYKGGSFGSIEEWLKKICEEEKPKMVIDGFSLGLFEGEDYHLFLVGKQDSLVGDDHYSTIAFEPQYMYYKLPKASYAGLSREQMHRKIAEEVKRFVSSKKFKSCFLSEAKSFTMEYSGENLLHR